ncbi:unnamed protein product [Closterium sp. NIES-65]|nr:unnamed protein product [Closterium sp. NIES-65]
MADNTKTGGFDKAAEASETSGEWPTVGGGRESLRGWGKGVVERRFNVPEAVEQQQEQQQQRPMRGQRRVEYLQDTERWLNDMEEWIKVFRGTDEQSNQQVLAKARALVREKEEKLMGDCLREQRSTFEVEVRGKWGVKGGGG